MSDNTCMHFLSDKTPIAPILHANFLMFFLYATVKAPVSRLSRAAEIVSVTGASHLQECVNTKTVREPGKKGFCQGDRK